MKKIIAMLLALVMVLGLAACATKTEPAQPEETTPAETTDTPAAEEPTPAETETEEPAATEATGSVYYLNFKPEADEAWQKLAATYTEQTGVPVKVVTAASGTYDTTLAAELDKSSAPTLFQCGNQGAINSYGDYCYPFDGTAIMDQMTTDAFNLKGEDGQTLAIGYCYEAFGIIVNKALLEKAGHSIDEITNFESLKAVADDIHARADELGFDAFSSAGLEGSSSWRFSGHLANMPLYYEFRDDGVTAQPATITGAYLNNFKNIWDLYTTDSATTGAALATATGDESEAEFGEGKAAFYQNGTLGILQPDWHVRHEPGRSGYDPPSTAVLTAKKKPVCALALRTAGPSTTKPLKKTFRRPSTSLVWVVTSDEGTTMLAQEFGPCPFKDAKEPENVFFQDANKYTADGKYVVTWAFNWTPAVDDWRAAVVDALTQYSAGTGDWSAVETAFVQGWATSMQRKTHKQ